MNENENAQEEERTIIWGCTPGMVIEEKYLPPPVPKTPVRLPANTISVVGGGYDMFIRPASRLLHYEEYPTLRFWLEAFTEEPAELHAPQRVMVFAVLAKADDGEYYRIGTLKKRRFLDAPTVLDVNDTEVETIDRLLETYANENDME